MTVIEFPAGMTTVTVTGTLSSLGRPQTGAIRVTAERKFGYAGSDWIMDEVSPWVRLKAGKFSVRIPHSNQTGLIGDNGATVTNIGYLLELQPDQSGPARTLLWTLLPTSLGAGPVAFSTLANLNGWPNAVIVTTPPTDPTPGAATQLVETYPGSRIFRKA